MDRSGGSSHLNIGDLPEDINRDIFWSYKKNAVLPIDIVVEQVLIYGGLKDIISLLNFLENPKVVIKIYKGRIRERWISKTPEYIRFFDLFLEKMVRDVA